MRTVTVNVQQMVLVTMDEAKFTPEFMAEFRATMYSFATVDEHIEHLGQLYARGLVDGNSFIEGYGPAEEFGIGFEALDSSQEILK